MRSYVVIVSLFACIIGSPAAADFTFRGLGGLPSPDLLSAGSSISADGLVAAGTGNVPGGTQAIRWTAGSGLIGIGDLPGGAFASQAHGISPDGGFVVGSSSSASGFEAFLWSPSGMIGLGDLAGTGSFSSFANTVSVNGEVVVGASQRPFGPSQYAAFRWTRAAGIQPLGEFPGGDNFSIAFDVSDDGAIIVGASSGAAGSEAFRWTSSGGMLGLGDLPGGGFSSSAQAISGDGRVIVGSGLSERGFEAFRWTAAGGMEALGDISGGIFSSGANAVSADGNVIVGSGSGVADSDGAFVWTRSLGMVSLEQYLAQNGVVGLIGWHLTYARGISADGKTIVGAGVNPDGLFEGWLATIDLDSSSVDTGETIGPTRISSTLGAISGGISALRLGDDQYLVLRAQGNEMAQIVVEAEFSEPRLNHLALEIESRSNRAGTGQTVELFDFDAGAWVRIDSRGTSTFDSVASVTVSSNPLRFIESGTLRILTRITWRNPSAKKRNRIDIFVDRIEWTRIP